MKKIKLLVIAALIGTLMMCPIYAAAETPEGITEIEYPPVYLDDENMARTVGTAVISFNRESSTVGEGYAAIATTAVASYIKVTVTLQQAASGSTSYTNSTQDPVSKTVYNSISVRKNFSFKVTSNKNYRVKVVVKDKTNGVVSTRTLYKKLT